MDKKTINGLVAMGIEVDQEIYFSYVSSQGKRMGILPEKDVNNLYFILSAATLIDVTEAMAAKGRHIYDNMTYKMEINRILGKTYLAIETSVIKNNPKTDGDYAMIESLLLDISYFDYVEDIMDVATLFIVGSWNGGIKAGTAQRVLGNSRLGFIDAFDYADEI